jgi:hypothetical protein
MAVAQALIPPFPPWWPPVFRHQWSVRFQSLFWLPAVNPPAHWQFNYRLAYLGIVFVPVWLHEMVIDLNQTRSGGVPVIYPWWYYVEEVERLMEPAMLRRLRRVRRMLDIV